MVNNYGNINKTNYHLPSQLTEHKIRPRHMTLLIQMIHILGQAQTYGRVNPVNGILTIPSWPLDQMLVKDHYSLQKKSFKEINGFRGRPE
jgi:hypothetical protein